MVLATAARLAGRQGPLAGKLAATQQKSLTDPLFKEAAQIAQEWGVSMKFPKKGPQSLQVEKDGGKSCPSATCQRVT